MMDHDLVPQLRRSFAAALEHEGATTAREELLAAGWLDALEHDEPVAVALVFRLQGSTRRDAAALDDVIVHHLSRTWPELADGLAVAYPVRSATPTDDDITHVVLPGHGGADRLLWMSDLSGHDLRVIELDDRLSGHPVNGVDPMYGLLGQSRPPPGRTTPLSDDGAGCAWARALAAGRIALAHQINAGSNSLLASASAYARHRAQFGQPIGSFQAVKHRLAETHVAVSSADAAAVAAASAPSPTASAVAKALAGRAAAAAARHCLQIFGGIGFTTEHDFHPYFRRSLVLDRLLGDHRAIERRLGEQLRRGELARQRVIELDHIPLVDLLGAPSTTEVGAT